MECGNGFPEPRARIPRGRSYEVRLHDTAHHTCTPPRILVRPRHADRAVAAYMADQLLPRLAANVALAYRRTNPVNTKVAMTADDMRALRKRLGMTQAQLADALGVDVSTISNYEGARGPYKIPRRAELAVKAVARGWEL